MDETENLYKDLSKYAEDSDEEDFYCPILSFWESTSLWRVFVECIKTNQDIMKNPVLLSGGALWQILCGGADLFSPWSALGKGALRNLKGHVLVGFRTG